MITIYESTGENPNQEEEKTHASEMFESKLSSFSPMPVNEGVDRKSILTPYVEEFLKTLEEKIYTYRSKGEPSVQVSEVLGGLARIYEKIRTTVEYKGEHVLRRNAIERILKRLIWEQQSIRANIDNKKVASTLVKELIWARYLPNGSVSESKVEDVEKVIDKYIYFLENMDNLPKDVSIAKVRMWIWGIASSELEETVDPSYRELYVKLMHNWFSQSFKWEDKDISEHDKNIQIYLAVHRSFTKSDDQIMRYHLLLKEFPEWKNASKSQINKFILEFSKIYSEIENHLDFPGRLILYRKIQKHSAAFEIFRELATQEKLELAKLLKDKNKFSEKIRSICEVKYKQISKRVATGIVRSIIYIFITKVIFAMMIEIPYEIFFYGDVRYIPLGINMLIPPIIMWMIGLSIRVPGAKNTESIVSRLNWLVYRSEDKIPQQFSINKIKKSTPLTTIFGLFYSLIFILVFGGITYVLTLVNYTLFGIMIFFMFLSLVMLFAFRVRYNASQLRVDSDDENIFGHLTSYFTLPFLNFGFYLSRGLAKLNFFTILLDFIIEIPLKNIIEVFEEWTRFLRQKKEEVVEIPE